MPKAWHATLFSTKLDEHFCINVPNMLLAHAQDISLTGPVCLRSLERKQKAVWGEGEGGG